MPLEIPLVGAKEMEKAPEKKAPEKKAPEKKAPEKKAPEKKAAPIRKTLEIPLIEAEEVVPEKISREPVGAKPVIPTKDGCCIGVCTYLNREVDVISQAIKIRQEELKFMAAGASRLKTKRQVTALTNKISTLKDMRYALLDKSICKCIEPPPKG